MCPSRASAGQSGGVDISGNIGFVEGDIVGRDKITYGLDEEKLVAVLERRGVIGPAETAGLERQTIIKLALRLRPDEGLDFNQAVRELERAVEVALDVIARGEQGSDQDAFVNVVLAQVAEKTRTGDLEGGASAIDQGLAELSAAYRRQQIALLEEGVKVDILRRDAGAVVRRIEILVTIDHPTERPAWLPTSRERYDAFCAEGKTKGVNFSLSVAIEMARRMLATARDGTERGVASSLLGIPLGVLGERESGTERLEEAVAAFRAALAERTRERVPRQWAATQSNLGNALRILGEREGGTERLVEAVAAFHAALQEWTRERVPLDWASAQSNLGLALQRLGERESGTARLEEAMTAYHAALEERTQERAPLQWAMTQDNLGTTLRTLGERESGTARLTAAATAFRAALQERTRERVPLDWAQTQNNLGNALASLGERESGTERLEEAVAVYRATLQEFTRERAPLQWAMTQNNFGLALTALGEREGGTERLEEAVAAFDAALAVFASAEGNYYASVFRANRERSVELLLETKVAQESWPFG